MEYDRVESSRCHLARGRCHCNYLYVLRVDDKYTIETPYPLKCICRLDDIISITLNIGQVVSLVTCFASRRYGHLPRATVFDGNKCWARPP